MQMISWDITLILVLLNRICAAFANSVDPNQWASSETNWSGICTICHKVCEFVSTTWIKWSDWLKIWSGCCNLICSACHGSNKKGFQKMSVSWVAARVVHDQTAKFRNSSRPDAGPDKSIARPPGTSPKSRRASLGRLYDARSGKCQKIARTIKSASIYGKKSPIKRCQ